MKKVSALFSIIFIIGFVSILMIKNDKQTEETPKILTELRDNGIIEGKREFIFSIENIGKNEAELQFLSWLEYNYSLQYFTDENEVSFDGTTEHVDLKEGNKARKVVLKPNEKIEYRLHLSGFPKGKYEITVSPAVDKYNLGVQKKVFFIE